jgi:hypothetical protein
MMGNLYAGVVTGRFVVVVVAAAEDEIVKRKATKEP